ncbi:SDR family oxidoreductase [Stackebrandtia soli]|uniref:SDR family oxidoreductase n=1 Tax=Stackebrandtia soli TaxID=1892856 RepID=UPI0039E94534
MTTPSIAVTGATGALGGAVAARLAAQGVPQRLIVRDPKKAPALDAAETNVAEYADVAAMRRALRGVRTVLMVSLPESVDRMAAHTSAIEAMAEAGVERVVYTSFLSAAPHATFTFAREHCATERAILDAGLSLTALRNSLYADLAPYFVGEDGVLRGPAGTGRVAWVARSDIARLAVATLLDDAHADAVYDVTGPVAIDLTETARLLSVAAGKPVEYVAETETEARASRSGADKYLVDGWVGSYLAIATGELSVVSHTIEQVTGRRPLGLAEVLAGEHARPQDM